VSLASLYCHVARVLEGETENGGEALRAGDIWNSRGNSEQASRLWDMAMRDPSSRMEAVLRIAGRAKKNQEHETARDHFLTVLAELKGHPRTRAAETTLFSVLEELAKIEEHRFRSPTRALEFVKEALSQLKKSRYYGGRLNIELEKSMERRRVRLEKKINARNNTEKDKDLSENN
jgi:hypothetical protein